MKKPLIIALLVSICSYSAATTTKKNEIVCDNVRVLKSGDLVLDKKTASKIAEVILPTIYGNEILKQMPFNITSSEKSWIVSGTSSGSAYTMGGVSIEIRKSDGKIISVSNDK